MKKYLKYIILGIALLIGGIFVVNPNIIHYFDIQECKGLISEKMKDPDSTKFLEYVVEQKENYFTISGKYKATNSYGAYIQGTFICDTMGTKMTGLVFDK